MVNKPCCIDVYHGDDVSDNPTSLAGLDRAKASGIFALIHKATEGTEDRDQRYDARRAKWMTGGLIPVTDVDGTKLSLSPIFGAYHFFHGTSTSDAVAEAKNFLMTARLKPGDMAFLDWEAVGASGFQPSIAVADTFCQTVEDALGAPIGVYGGNVPRERFAASPASADVLERFSKRPFWFAAYGGIEDLTELPEPWTKIGSFLWQDDGDRYGPGPHSIPGISGNCDNSTVVAPMTFAALHSQWLANYPGKVAPIPKPAPPPPEVIKPAPAPIPEAKPVAPVPEESVVDKVEDVVEEIETTLETDIKNAEAKLEQLRKAKQENKA
jgi:GH25 family lysozyme M1 (1,4-beta-N-acetylmuramidase)